MTLDGASSRKKAAPRFLRKVGDLRLKLDTGLHTGKQARQLSHRVQTLYQRLFEGVPIGLYRILPTGQVLEANPALLHLFGYTNLQGLLDVGIAQHSADEEAYQVWQHQLNSEAVLRDFEMPMRRCDGTAIWVRHNARSIRNKAGDILYYEGPLTFYSG
ncbi:MULTISPECIES: PAS domain-containing protein [unclassified Coleofasciculus]|uniref:PAS domain-containing protein n=1 Tax=unclassified Coleofasciculus TaxID=2692782 RepID=UPI001882F1C8|nr:MULTISPECIES: PAS domain-containing protein [unclassified Coleofasciculus]MBE9127518.1 PAS domain-containing protein [Coleofasciculus sp. LEGE 07081]MBE9150820.1 PAS domain-containing protein [Coleofasciculus sp. LEGE 07092]